MSDHTSGARCARGPWIPFGKKFPLEKDTPIRSLVWAVTAASALIGCGGGEESPGNGAARAETFSVVQSHVMPVSGLCWSSFFGHDDRLFDCRMLLEGIGWQAPRVTIVVASLEPRTLGVAMKKISGTLRTIIQVPGSSSAVAA